MPCHRSNCFLMPFPIPYPLINPTDMSVWLAMSIRTDCICCLYYSPFEIAIDGRAHMTVTDLRTTCMYPRSYTGIGGKVFNARKPLYITNLTEDHYTQDDSNAWKTRSEF